jgi:hypothetical protein
MHTVFNKPKRALKAEGNPPILRALNRPPVDDLPPPTSMPKSALLPNDASDDLIKQTFYKTIDPKSKGKPPLAFIDKVGDPLMLTDRLFEDYAGVSKLRKFDRHEYTALLAETIRDPDEIWLVWEFDEHNKSYGLHRRYFKTFQVDGKDQVGLSAFDIGKSGWQGSTVFNADRRKYLWGQRGGTRIYQRP